MRPTRAGLFTVHSSRGSVGFRTGPGPQLHGPDSMRYTSPIFNTEKGSEKKKTQHTTPPHRSINKRHGLYLRTQCEKRVFSRLKCGRVSVHRVPTPGLSLPGAYSHWISVEVEVEGGRRRRRRACETAPLLLATEKRRKLFANNRSIYTPIKCPNDH